MKYNEIKVFESEYEDLDNEYPFVTNELDKFGELVCNNVSFHPNIFSETNSISIQDLEDVLKNLKEEKAERVYIYPHTDHRSYIFTGVQYEQI